MMLSSCSLCRMSSLHFPCMSSSGSRYHTSFFLGPPCWLCSVYRFSRLSMMVQKSSAFSLVMFSMVLKQSVGLLGENFFGAPGISTTRP